MTTTPSARYDIAVVGEAFVDVTVAADGTRSERLGNGPAALAQKLARLGTPTTLLTTFGDDPRGRALDHQLCRCGVRVVRAGCTGVATSTITTHLDRPGADTIDVRWELDHIDPPVVDHVHVGSLGVVRGPGAEDVARLVECLDPDTTVSYDVGVRASAMGPWDTAVERVGDMIARSTVVTLSDEDLAWLRPSDRHGEAVRWLMSRGPSVLVLTHGITGATAITRDGSVRIPTHRVDTTDIAEWKDAFMAGLLYSLTERDLLGHRRDTQRLRAVGLDGLRQILLDANRCADRQPLSRGLASASAVESSS